jgi:prepilin-type N-terminal cleavage/methylation domain-containing protein
MIKSHTRLKASPAFTIVELLVVIVVIGILAAITIVSYIGISQRATVAAITSDLDSASRQLKLFQVTNGSYPATIDCSQANSSTNQCIKASSGATFAYTPNNSANPPTFSLTETASNNTTAYTVTESTAPTQVAVISCPTGFIPVPGSSTYGTSNFCVMKYEAKIQGNDNGNQTYSSSFIPESRPTGTPWVNISQTNAIAEAQTVPGCTGCHLINEAEWMTIAQNVLSVASNWSGGAVGSGYIYSGHNDNAPGSALAADTSDTNGYIGETNTGGNQRRTLTLT